MTSTLDTLIDEILSHYVACALWSSTDDEGEPMDDTHDADDLPPETLASMREDVTNFLGLLADEGVEWQGIVSPAQFGHDLWLTRNGHGAGFWDRGLGELGDTLSKWSRSFGSSDMYVGDDGLIYVA